MIGNKQHHPTKTQTQTSTTTTTSTPGAAGQSKSFPTLSTKQQYYKMNTEYLAEAIFTYVPIFVINFCPQFSPLFLP